jgi:hypothetical protein
LLRAGEIVKPEDVHLTDWKRLLLGTAPWSFTIEVVLRTVVLYLALIAILRVLGKRLSGQLTFLEMGVMITLGAIVSAPMVLPDKGIVIGFVLLVCALFFLRGTGRLGVASDRFERLAHGDATLLVKDGALVTEALDSAALSRNVLYAALRSKGIYHLGEVKRVYLEACGLYSIVKATEPRPGLSIFPAADRESVGHCRAAEGHAACSACGFVGSDGPAATDPCPRCGDRSWTAAIAIGAPS